MPNYYEFNTDCNNFAIFYLKEDPYGDEGLIDELRQEIGELKSLKDTWDPSRYLLHLDESGGPEADILTHGLLAAPLLSERALDILWPFMKKNAEPLEFRSTEGKTYYVLHFTHLSDVIDFDKSELFFAGKILMRIGRHSFKESVSKEHFFCLPRLMGTRPSVSQEFVQAVADHGLKGATFEPLRCTGDS